MVYIVSLHLFREGLYCVPSGCRTVYYPNYVVHGDVRQYYAGIPEFIQVSGHKYIARDVLEHFTTLSVLSWTSATNAAHIYHESMSQLVGDARTDPQYRLRPAHTWDGFVLLALLRDTRVHGGVLEVPHTGQQKDRLKAAMQRRNERIRRSGQPEYAHWCNKCVRRFDDSDGVTRTSMNTGSHVRAHSYLSSLQVSSTASSQMASTLAVRAAAFATVLAL